MDLQRKENQHQNRGQRKQNNQQLIGQTMENKYTTLSVEKQYFKILTTNQFYLNNKHYSPICSLSNQQNQPIFLSNIGYCQNIFYLLLLNLFWFAVVCLLALRDKTKNPNQFQQILTINNLIRFMTVLGIFFIDFVYLMVQFKNPGVANLTKLTKQHFQKPDIQKYFCYLCEYYRDQYSRHCGVCGVCIKSLDHHCGYFNKCIGKDNIHWFRLLGISFVFGFLMLFTSVGKSFLS